MSAILEAALEYQQAGLWVIPLKPKGKLPLIKWKNRVTEKPDEIEIRGWFSKWPDANIGILTGKYSGIDVLDLDGTDVVEKFRAVVYDNPDESIYQNTGKKGGIHCFFRHNGGKYKNSAAMGGILGVDLRTTGGLVVMAPSIHHSGVCYQWGNNGNIIDGLIPDSGMEQVPHMPDELNTWLESQCKKTGSAEFASEAELEPASREARLRGFRIVEWMNEQGLEVIRVVSLKSAQNTSLAKSGLLFVMDRCLFADNHESGTSTRGEAGIGITDSGALFYHCFHGSCSNKTWFDVANHYGADVVAGIAQPDDTIEIMTAADIQSEGMNRTLQIPDDIWQDRGLITEGMKAAVDLSAINIVQYNLPNVIALLSRALAGKIRCGQSAHPSCFFIKVGSTSTGKSQSDRALKHVIAPLFEQPVPNQPGESVNTFYGVTDFASGPGLMRSVSQNGMGLISMDEITFLFSSSLGSKSDPVTQGKTAAILELSTASGGRLEKAYSDGGKNIIINNAVLNLVGNATPLIFKSLSLDDFQSGLIQRFDFWAYDGIVPYRDRLPDSEAVSGHEFAKKLFELKNIAKPQKTYDLITDNAVDVGYDDAAKKIIIANSNRIIDDVNAEPDEGLRGIVSRRYDASIKFALIHSGATRVGVEIFAPIGRQDIEFGIRLADILADWKLHVLTGRVAAGEFDATCQIFVEAAKAVVRTGKNPTFKTMCNRKPQLKNLNPKELQDTIDMCVRQRLIIVDSTGRVDKYQPAADLS